MCCYHSVVEAPSPNLRRQSHDQGVGTGSKFQVVCFALPVNLMNINLVVIQPVAEEALEKWTARAHGGLASAGVD